MYGSTMPEALQDRLHLASELIKGKYFPSWPSTSFRHTHTACFAAGENGAAAWSYWELVSAQFSALL